VKLLTVAPVSFGARAKIPASMTFLLAEKQLAAEMEPARASAADRLAESGLTQALL